MSHALPALVLGEPDVIAGFQLVTRTVNYLFDLHKSGEHQHLIGEYESVNGVGMEELFEEHEAEIETMQRRLEAVLGVVEGLKRDDGKKKVRLNVGKAR